MMRHSHIDTTVNHYLKADPRKMKSATTAVDDALDLCFRKRICFQKK
jgi:hypothetical protein